MRGLGLGNIPQAPYLFFKNFRVRFYFRTPFKNKTGAGELLIKFMGNLGKVFFDPKCIDKMLLDKFQKLYNTIKNSRLDRKSNGTA